MLCKRQPAMTSPKIVMPGLHPGIHAVPRALAVENSLRGRRPRHPVDGRVKPCHDGWWGVLLLLLRDVVSRGSGAMVDGSIDGLRCTHLMLLK
jgi:hypothetical protein